jgi:hypothetical protein
VRYGISAICLLSLLYQDGSPGEIGGVAKLINLEHLDHLTEEITIAGTPMLITHIYSEYPAYTWVDAPGEGITCIDDVARCVVVYLQYYELFGIWKYLDMAKKALNFVMYMEQNDGEFYNFIYSDHTINTTGETSQKSFSFWAARALRALCRGYKFFSAVEPAYAETLRVRAELAFRPLNEILKSYGEYSSENGTRVPAWLVCEGGDATSEVVLALLDYWETNPTTNVEVMIRKFSRALSEYQEGCPDLFPYGAHLSWRNHWHAWGNGQTHALARAGHLFGEEQWVASAREEAENFYLYLIGNGFLSAFELSPSGDHRIAPFPQISYGIRPMVSGLIGLFEATNDDRYARLAGLTASWLIGNNVARLPMYNSDTGRCYDGINGPLDVNRNAGAESTIEALLTLLAVADCAPAEEYYRYRLVDGAKAGFRIYESPTGSKIEVGRNGTGQ